jgi:hypothetical protein
LITPPNPPPADSKELNVEGLPFEVEPITPLPPPPTVTE